MQVTGEPERWGESRPWKGRFWSKVTLPRCPLELGASLTNRRGAARIVELSPAEVGLWRSLGARFHGMEEVIGSIPIRSTK